MAEPILIETDARGGAVLPGHPSQRFVMRVNEDGSILLQPAHLVAETQSEFDTDAELRGLLARAGATPTIRRSRHRRYLFITSGRGTAIWRGPCRFKSPSIHREQFYELGRKRSRTRKRT